MKTTRELIDYCMQNEAKIQRAIIEKRLDRDAPRGCGRCGGIKRPTEAKALRNLEPVGVVLLDNFVVIDKPEDVLRLIAKVKIHFNNAPQGKLYYVHYIKGNDYTITCKALGISTSTYYNYVNAILDYAEKLWGDMFG